MNVNLKSLIEKLTPSARNTLEAAAGLCVTRTHYDVEVEHYLMKLLDDGPGDFEKIRRRFGVDDSRLSADLTRSLDALKSGNARVPAFSPTIVKMLSAAWQVGSLEFGHEEIRTGATILALVSDPELARMAREISKELQKIDAQALQTEFGAILAGSPEDMETAVASPGGGPAPAGGAPRPDGKKSKLDQFTIDLTANARAGKIDPVLGRDREIRQVVDILMRRRQNNPILTGEAGVKGEFENRLKGLIEEVKSSPTPIILFIDEAHTMIGAGGQEGQGDAANLLKPALARGELRTLAATTWSEYKKYFEKDAPLARRFQVGKVEEPEELQCMVMLRGIAPALEKHHGVRILDEAVQSAVRLSHRYMVGRQLPDKAVSVLDTACARLALGHNSTPPPIEDATRRLDDLAVQERILKRESSTGADHAERLEKIAADKAVVEAQLATLREHFEKERELVAQIRELRSRLEGELPPGELPNEAEAAAARAEGAALNATLDQLQGEQPLMRVCVDAQNVGEVIDRKSTRLNSSHL